MASDKQAATRGRFWKELEVRWADVDANGHLANTAYSNFCTDVRFAFMAQHGFGWHRFEEIGIGPVLLEEKLEYRHEALLGEKVVVDFVALGLSPDAARWRVRHQVFKADGRLSARVTLYGGFIHFTERRLVSPPPALADAMRDLERAPDFEELKPLGR